ncbi:MAG TPA: tyrosine-type recombinase/integrase, partial [Polyangia bacterium]|nr:tyrosine-type recombinase/integrase [Polyangia bacterium]
MPRMHDDFLEWQRLRGGPLGPQLDAFAETLTEKGYSSATVALKVRVAAKFGRWLGRRGLAVGGVDEQTVAGFVQCHRCPPGRGYATTLRDLLEQVRSAGLAPPAPAKVDDTTIGRTVSDFDRYLSVDRGLSVATRINYLPIVRSFLAERFDGGEAHLDALGPRDAGEFLVRHAHVVHPARAGLMVSALRGFLRWVHLRGDVSIDLAATVPSVAYWRLATVPKSIPARDVEQLLRRCRRRSEAGLRDHAILMLMARLGLRGGEVVALDLGDFDWGAGTLQIHGKGGRQDLLPLPADVGDAIAQYLRHGRPACSCRSVFVRARAPRRGFASTVAVCTIVRRAL